MKAARLALAVFLSFLLSTLGLPAGWAQLPEGGAGFMANFYVEGVSRVLAKRQATQVQLLGSAAAEGAGEGGVEGGGEGGGGGLGGGAGLGYGGGAGGGGTSGAGGGAGGSESAGASAAGAASGGGTGGGDGMSADRMLARGDGQRGDGSLSAARTGGGGRGTDAGFAGAIDFGDQARFGDDGRGRHPARTQVATRQYFDQLNVLFGLADEGDGDGQGRGQGRQFGDGTGETTPVDNNFDFGPHEVRQKGGDNNPPDENNFGAPPTPPPEQGEGDRTVASGGAGGGDVHARAGRGGSTGTEEGTNEEEDKEQEYAGGDFFDVTQGGNPFMIASAGDSSRSTGGGQRLSNDAVAADDIIGMLGGQEECWRYSAGPNDPVSGITNDLAHYLWDRYPTYSLDDDLARIILGATDVASRDGDGVRGSTITDVLSSDRVLGALLGETATGGGGVGTALAFGDKHVLFVLGHIFTVNQTLPSYTITSHSDSPGTPHSTTWVASKSSGGTTSGTLSATGMLSGGLSGTITSTQSSTALLGSSDMTLVPP